MVEIDVVDDSIRPLFGYVSMDLESDFEENNEGTFGRAVSRSAERGVPKPELIEFLALIVTEYVCPDFKLLNTFVCVA